MTKKLFESLEKATNEDALYGWLYDHEEELSKDEVLRIALEISNASLDPFATTETVSRYSIKQTFLYNLADYYNTFGWDDEEAE